MTIAAFGEGRSLMLNACAGSGKTATLLAMARSDKRRGLYIVFSKAAAAHAKTLFPSRVEVRTSHALAVRHAFSIGYGEDKLFASLNANAIARLLALRDLHIAGGVLRTADLGHAVRRTLTAYCHSADERVGKTHVPRPEHVAALAPNDVERYRAIVAGHAAGLWSRMRDAGDAGVPLGHDGYFKLWSLARPALSYDYVLLDEAQDSNPALLHVLSHQRGVQRVYVGDRYQQIYAWRGAVNAMDQLEVHQCALTRSFRYAQPIADLATRLLEPLGNTRRLSGRQDVDGSFVSRRPDAYLSRTNTALVQTLIELKERLDQVHLVGGGRDILALLEDVERLKGGKPASFGELFGFASWPAVVAFSAAAPDNPIRTLVSLVEQFGEKHLRALIEATCSDPERASVTLCTAHRAKGLEFDEVRLSADFPAPVERSTFVERHGEAALAEAVEIPSPDGPLLILREELQVLYVAATRARYHVTLPPWCYTLFADTVGPAPADVSDEPSASPAPFRSRSATGARTVLA